MKQTEFLLEDLEMRASVLLTEGIFINTRTSKDISFALFDLKGSFVEVSYYWRSSVNEGVLSIECIDSEQALSYVPQKALKTLFNF